MTTTYERVRAIVESGARVSVDDVATDLGVTRSAAYCALRRLRTEKLAAVVDQRPVHRECADGRTVKVGVVEVWGAASAVAPPVNTSIVAAAIASRPSLLTCWMPQ